MIEITDRDFDEEVLKCDLPVFACFTTLWCHTCFPTCLLADKLLDKYGDMVKYVRIKAEESPEVIQRYNIIVVPTILLFQNSQPVKKLIGFHNLKSLRALLDSVINESDRLPGERLEANKARENE
jgi:thioredoxin 1